MPSDLAIPLLGNVFILTTFVKVKRKWGWRDNLNVQAYRNG